MNAEQRKSFGNAAQTFFQCAQEWARSAASSRKSICGGTDSSRQAENHFSDCLERCAKTASEISRLIDVLTRQSDELDAAAKAADEAE